MKLTIIGCDGAYPKAGGATSSYLIEEGDTKILFDCGSGSLAKLQEVIHINDLDAVFISHYHRDHYADLECLHVAVGMNIENGSKTTKLDIYGPGQEEILAYKEFCNGYSYVGNEKTIIGNLTIETKKTQHAREAYGFKITNSAGDTIVYTGDSGYFPEFVEFVQGANILVADTSFYDFETGKSSGHMSSTEVGRLAHEADVKKLVLSHLPHSGENEKLLEEAKIEFLGEILLANYLDCHIL